MFFVEDSRLVLKNDVLCQNIGKKASIVVLSYGNIWKIEECLVLGFGAGLAKKIMMKERDYEEKI